MSKNDKIAQFKKRKLLLDNDIYELDPEDRSPVNSPATTTLESSADDVITLDTSQGSDALNNLSESVIFDKTVGPGAAPEGYILIDEDVSTDQADKTTCQNDTATEVSSPIFKVMFRDNNTVRQYRKTIEDFLQNLLPAKTKSRTDSTDLVLEIWDDEVHEDGEILLSTEAEESQESIDNELFMIDTEPKLRDDLDVPTYGKKFEKILEKTTKDTEPESNAAEERASQLTCFNCQGNHNLRDCPKPRNPATINRSRKEFNAKMGPRNGRYHLDEDQKFGHFVPGQLSKNLRRALGLREHELPKHIYRMRILGYPPGWLEEARVQHSGLSLFNSDGKAIVDPTEEEGEVFVDGDKDEFDIKKIHDFPGFNVSIPHGTRDEHAYYQVPCMQMIHSKDLMLSQLAGRKVQDGYKRKKMKPMRTETSTDASVIPKEMDVEDIEECPVEAVSTNGLFIPPLPKDTPPRQPEPPITSEDSDTPQSPDFPAIHSLTSSTWADSPSLSDLEGTKRHLLAELDDSNSLSNPGTPINHGKSSSISDTPVSQTRSPSSSAQLQNSETRSVQCTPNARNSKNTGGVKSVDLGTPVIQSTSPYNRLPPSEKFSKDICDVINFENLPDSVGKYEKMSELIQKVRGVVASLQQE